MRIIAIDPGVTTGLTYITDELEDHWVLEAHQTTSTWEASCWVDRRINRPTTLVVEDFISAGHLTKEAKHTLKVLGYFEIRYSWLNPETATPQKRKPFVTQAQELITNRGIPGPHSADALAHALAYLWRQGVQSPVFD